MLNAMFGSVRKRGKAQNTSKVINGEMVRNEILEREKFLFDGEFLLLSQRCIFQATQGLYSSKSANFEIRFRKIKRVEVGRNIHVCQTLKWDRRPSGRSRPCNLYRLPVECPVIIIRLLLIIIMLIIKIPPLLIIIMLLDCLVLDTDPDQTEASAVRHFHLHCFR